ncbi:hypothetical protein [Spirosoma pulveris]
MKKLSNLVDGKLPGAVPQGTATYGLLLVLLGSLLLNVYQLNEQNQQIDEARQKEAYMFDQTVQLQQTLSGYQRQMHQKDSVLYVLRSSRWYLLPACGPIKCRKKEQKSSYRNITMN